MKHKRAIRSGLALARRNPQAMVPMANVVFVWHMHQPYYVNPASQLAMMPWVRLHAVKGYLDMVTVLAEFPEIE